MKDKSTAACVVAVISLIIAVVSIIFSLKTPAAPGSGPAPEPPAQGQDEIVQYVVYIGTNDTDTYEPKYSAEDAKDIVDKICLKYFEGYTLQEATGCWIDEKSNVTHEYTIVCYFDGADKETVYKAADEIIVALNQNTLLIESSTVKIDYYSGK